METKLSNYAKYKSFLPIFILFSLSIVGILTTYVFQKIEDELDNEILVVEHQNLLLNVIKQYHKPAIEGNPEAQVQLKMHERSYKDSFEALITGGEPSVTEKFIIHGTSIPKAKQQLSSITGAWKDYQTLNQQAKNNFKKGSEGYASDLEYIDDKFYDLDDYNKQLLEVFIKHKKIYHNLKLGSIGTLIGLMTIVLIFSFIHYKTSINKPLEKLTQITQNIEHGNLSDKLKFKENSPIGQISASINRIIDNQTDLTEKFHLLGNGEFSFDIITHGRDDNFNSSLEEMRKKLFEFYELDRKKASQGNWVNKGLALFSEILRNNTDDLTKLSDILICELVKYLKANQGCIYLLEKDGKKDALFLKSTYAWERKKYVEGKIEIGEGLVGQAFLESDTIYLTDVPDNYINITSGLGTANPSAILIVPMIYNDEIYGVIEIASFKEYEEFELGLVKKVAESIASAISTVRNNEHTRHLLTESQKLTEQMKSQEEALRQNAEELQSTQENINKQLEIIDFEKQKNTAVLETSADGIVSFDHNGYVEFFNAAAEDIFLTSREKVIGQKIDEIIPFVMEKSGDGYTAKFKQGEELIDIGVRTEVQLKDSTGDDIDALMTLSQNNIQGKYYFAVFIQSISVELF